MSLLFIKPTFNDELRFEMLGNKELLVQTQNQRQKKENTKL